jgi:hypothetical protein
VLAVNEQRSPHHAQSLGSGATTIGTRWHLNMWKPANRTGGIIDGSSSFPCARALRSAPVVARSLRPQVRSSSGAGRIASCDEAPLDLA